MIALAILLLSQSLTLTPNQMSSFEYQTKLMDARTAPDPATSETERKAAFELRYQRFVQAMNKFTEKYQASSGNVWPHKEAVALRKAFQDLERMEPGFSSRKQ